MMRLLGLLATALVALAFADDAVQRSGSVQPYLCNALTTFVSNPSKIRCLLPKDSRHPASGRDVTAAQKTPTASFDRVGIRQQSDPCSNVSCGSFRVCRARKGKARCTCKLPCSRAQRNIGPVCGNDRRTYKSLCAMRRSACRAQLYVSFSHSGSCGKYADATTQRLTVAVPPTPEPRREDPVRKLENTARSQQNPQLLSRLFRIRINQYVRQNGISRLSQPRI